ncbi:hypothetical protein E4U61_005798 [Claviceps capensis]|nr:hypothetical protein E4U61_005798 [Claviceps capensis]
MAMVRVQRLTIALHNVWEWAVMDDSHLCLDSEMVLGGTLKESQILSGGSEVVCLVDNLREESSISNERCCVSIKSTIHCLDEIAWTDIPTVIDAKIATACISFVTPLATEHVSPPARAGIGVTRSLALAAAPQLVKDQE